MSVRVEVEHISAGYMEIWKSGAMQAVVDAAGGRMADEANGGLSFEAFRYYPQMGSFTAMGFVSSTGPTGAIYQQQWKTLSRAVHR